MLSLLFGLASGFRSGVGQGRINIPWCCKYVVCWVSTFRQQLPFFRERLRRVRHNGNFNSHPGRGFNRNYPKCSKVSVLFLAVLALLPFSSLIFTSRCASSNQNLSRLSALSYLVECLHSMFYSQYFPLPHPSRHQHYSCCTIYLNLKVFPPSLPFFLPLVDARPLQPIYTGWYI